MILLSIKYTMCVPTTDRVKYFKTKMKNNILKLTNIIIDIADIGIRKSIKTF